MFHIVTCGYMANFPSHADVLLSNKKVVRTCEEENMDTIAFEAQDEKLWASILTRTEKNFSLNRRQVKGLKENRLLRMFALLPSIAECPDAEAVGFLNVSIYLSERRAGRDLFAHRQNHDEDPLSRLKPFEQLMSEGNQEVVQKGLLHAAIVMVNDYHSDKSEDLQQKKYNPLLHKKWNYTTMLRDLLEKANSINCPRLNLVFSTNEAVNAAFWIG